MNFPEITSAVEFSDIRDAAEATLLPCPLCGEGTTELHAHFFWTGQRNSMVSVEVKHWCKVLEREPQRALIVAGSTLNQAIIAWNRRVTPSGIGRTEYIAKAAIWFEGRVYSLPPPARHPDIVRAFGGFPGPTRMGFLTGDNLFVDRAEALKVAISADQLLAPTDKPLLYTEDLWND